MINIGAYKAGSNKHIDFAIEKIDSINSFLQQGVEEKFLFDDIVDQMRDIFQDRGEEDGME